MTSGLSKERQQALEQRGEIRIMVQCTASKTHTKLITVDPALGMEYARQFAGLLDGSSTLYIHKPGPNSPIGKCGICQGQIKCTVEERLPENAEPQEQGGEAAVRIIRAEDGAGTIREPSGAPADAAPGTPDAGHKDDQLAAVDRLEP